MDHPNHQTVEGEFELSGGALCLDYVNTWGNRGDRASDRIMEYERLLGFGLESGQLDEASAELLRRSASTSPELAATALERARALRESLYALFSSAAMCTEIPDVALAHLNDSVGEAFAQRQLRLEAVGIEWSWKPVGESDLLAMLWPCVESATTLLTSDELGRVRQCDAEDCSWLFLDRSRSRSRRWCSMESCGNRAKARRHYQKRHQ